MTLFEIAVKKISFIKIKQFLDNQCSNIRNGRKLKKKKDLWKKKPSVYHNCYNCAKFPGNCPKSSFLETAISRNKFYVKSFCFHKLNPGQTLGNKRKLIIVFYTFFIITPRSLIYDTSSIKRFLGVPCNPIKLLTIVTFVYTKK